MTATSDSAAPLLIERVTVTPKRVEAVVRVRTGVSLRTSAVPGLSAAALHVLPGLARHRCECGSAHGIVAELLDTELPHLLEHVALELMVLSGSPRTLEGDTRWDFATDGHGVFRVSLGYDDDLIAIAALREGALMVEALIAGTASAETVAPVIERLRTLRGDSAAGSSD